MDVITSVGFSIDSLSKGITSKLFRGEVSRELVDSKNNTIISNFYSKATKVIANIISR